MYLRSHLPHKDACLDGVHIYHTVYQFHFEFIVGVWINFALLTILLLRLIMFFMRTIISKLYIGVIEWLCHRYHHSRFAILMSRLSSYAIFLAVSFARRIEWIESLYNISLGFALSHSSLSLFWNGSISDISLLNCCCCLPYAFLMPNNAVERIAHGIQPIRKRPCHAKLVTWPRQILSEFEKERAPPPLQIDLPL